MSALIRSGPPTVEAYADWSRWVARCGSCRYGTERLRPHHPLLRPRTHEVLPRCFECRMCGALNEVQWPADSMVAGVERLLMMRPDPSTRNWLPGETLRDLMRENAEHGIFDHLDLEALGATPGVPLLKGDDFGIRVDQLPALKPRIRQAIA